MHSPSNSVKIMCSMFLKDKFSPTGISLYSSKGSSLISLLVVGSYYIQKQALNEFSLCDGFLTNCSNCSETPFTI